MEQLEPLDADFYISVLEENRSAVRAAVSNALMEGIKRKFEWELPDAVNKAVSAFIEEEIVPEVRANLLASKDTFVDAATEMVRAVPAEIGKAMQEALAQNLSNSWTLRNVVDACFK